MLTLSPNCNERIRMVQNQILRLSSRNLILKYKKEKKSIKHDLLNLNPLLPEIFYTYTPPYKEADRFENYMFKVSKYIQVLGSAFWKVLAYGTPKSLIKGRVKKLM